MIDSRIEKMRPRTARREEREVDRGVEDESEDAAEHKARSTTGATSERRGRVCGRTRRLPRNHGRYHLQCSGKIRVRAESETRQN